MYSGKVITLQNPFLSVVRYKESTTSTMDDAREALKNGATHGSVFVAGTQSAGRGRLPGRQWEDDGDGALLFTLILSKAQVPTGLPLTQILALALCRYLEKSHGLSPSVKWPNDVLVQDAKIAGILVETHRSFYLAGLGVNLHQRDFPGSLRRPAISVVRARKNEEILNVDRLDFRTELESILNEIRDTLTNAPGAEILAGYLDSLNMPVTVLLGDPSRRTRLKGCVTGVAPDGALMIESADGEVHLVYSGELEYPTLSPE